MKFALLLLFWLLFLLLGAAINHFRKKKLDFSLAYLVFVLVLCVLDFWNVFNPAMPLYVDAGYAIGYLGTSYVALLLPIGFVSWRFRRKRRQDEARGPVLYRVEGYKDLGALNQWVAGFLYALIAVSGYSVITEVMNYQLLSTYGDGTYADPARLVDKAADVKQYQAAVAFYFKGILPIAACLLLRWIYRASFNAWRFAPQAMSRTPGRAAASFLVPFVPLWTLYQAMREIWQVSHGTPATAALKPSVLLRCWWGLLLVAEVLAASLLALAGSMDLALMKLAALVTLAASTVLIAFSIVSLVLVKRVHAAQRLRANEEPDAPGTPADDGQLAPVGAGAQP